MRTTILHLLDQAADEARENEGRVLTDTMMLLAAEGYDLVALEEDIAHLNDTEN